MVTLTVSQVSGHSVPARSGRTAVPAAPERSANPVSAEARGSQIPARPVPSVPALVTGALRSELLPLSTRQALSVFAQVAAGGDDNLGQPELAGIDIMV